VCLGWIFFRAASFHDATFMFTRLLTVHDGLPCPLPLGAFWTLLGVVAAAHAFGLRDSWPRLARRLPAPALGLSYALTLTLALLMAPAEANSFIYFNF
jgi:hypothetical protein